MNRSVLVVDDDKEFLEEAAETLSEGGYKVVTADSGKAAKEALKENHPTIVLIDKKLPDIDGQDLVEELKKISEKAYFIIITAYGDMESAIRGLRQGAVDFVNKPVSLEDIMRKMETFLKKEEREQQHIEEIRKWGKIENKKYKSLFEKANDAIFLVDAKSALIVDCNEIATNLLGYSKQDLLGKPIVFIVSASQREKCGKIFQNTASFSAATIETELQKSDGKKIPVSMSLSIVGIDGENYFQGIFRDLTELKSKEAAIRDSERRYRSLLNVVPGIVYVRKMPGAHAVYINERVKDILGFSQVEWLSDRDLWIKQIYPQDKKRVLRNYLKAVKNKSVFEDTYRMIHKDGHTIKWFRDNAVTAEVKEENAVLITGVRIDISDVVNRQDENERLSRAVKDISEGILITDTNGLIIYCNEALLRMFGYTNEEFLNKHADMIFSELSPPLLSAEIERSMMQARSWSGEVMAITKAEKVFPIFLRVDPLRDDVGHVKGAIRIIMDITEKRLLEDELRRRAQFLELAVEKRTKDLQKALDELEKVNQKLREYDILKSEFVANVAHELVNPLSIIKEGIAVADEEIKEAEVKKILGIAQREIERLLRFTGNMLDLSKIESGKMPSRSGRVNIKQLVKNVTEFFDNDAKKKNITILTDMTKSPDYIWVDPDLIREVFINLINNAFKYAPSGTSIEVKLAESENNLLIEIRDHGPGIAESEQKKIFDKFHRIFADRTEGTGLGLPISKEIVELHKGRIWVESEEGKGAKFVIVLPIDVRSRI